ncbi:dynamin family protein, partial [Anaerovibrio sp.]|uniref:dynamin family protein n=1 Tax=Anaerovibrio sp. TaxID=1872532 RepID=UPI003F13F87B
EDGRADSAPAADADGGGRLALHKWAAKLRRGSELTGRIPVLRQLSGELLERAERLEGKGFMVTLFGAFSAGKSSFANALLGEALLPVSPNPTTAAINKICPVDEAHPHGTVLVKLKDEAMLLADVNRALSAFQMSAGGMQEALALVKNALQDTSAGRQKEKAFLRAFVAGYQEAADYLGQELDRQLADFGAYAAREEKSCFVDWLAVYYDCPFTRLGITLVDTPGADSINARHTNMSFNYIRQSDVVLFVTYYNHAFSRADREFLIQLGRVKDAFALDKMFFIVNAIDLAESRAEAAGVVDYVAGQLKKYGVRKPQMFGLSSQQMLKDKLAGKTGGFAFEDAFYRFVLDELTGIAVNAAKGEYHLAAERVRELIRLNRSDAAEKERRRDQLLAFQRQTDKLLGELTSQDMQGRQRQERHELIYYVKQRVFLRYTDFFREAFNPALLKGRENSGGKLQEALNQLLESMGFDLAQELRATTLRMEQFIGRQAALLQQEVNGRLLEIDSELTIAPRDFAYESGMDYENAFKAVDKKMFSAALSGYKNPKSFFEEGGSKVMAAALEAILNRLADEYLSQQELRLAERLQAGTEEVFAKVKARFQRLLQANHAANLAALEGGVPAEVLEDVLKQLA